MADVMDIFLGLAEKPGVDHMRAVFDRYRALMTAGDLDGIVGLFAPDAVWVEPVGSKPEVGHDQIRARYKAALDSVGGKIPLVADGVARVAGNQAVAASVAYFDVGGQKMAVDTANAVICDEAGLITEMKIYVGPTSFRPI